MKIVEEHNLQARRIRVAAFVSHYHGHVALTQLCADPSLQVVIVATDDPDNPICKPSRRLWRLGWDLELKQLVVRRAAQIGLDAFTGDINGDDFMDRYRTAAPQVLVANVFGQRILQPLVATPYAYNLHMTIPQRPLKDTAGVCPLEKALVTGADAVNITLHRMTERFDDGEELAHSDSFSLPSLTSTPIADDRVLALYQASSWLTGQLIRDEFGQVLRSDGILA